MAAFTKSRVGLSPSARILVALSGGPDSSVLLIALCLAADAGLLPMPVGVAHFHHGLRGSDADGDAAFAAALASRYRLPCVIGLGKVRQDPGKSPDEAARDARYAFLRESARDLGADTIATAHTLDDQAETVLGRVLRGTGLAGLAGIPASRDLEPGLRLIRPLLSQRREAIEAFCRQQGLTARHDPDNDDDRYARSRLRKQMPMLAERFNPRLASSLGELARQATLDSDFIQIQATELWNRAVVLRPDGVQIVAELLRNAHPALRSRVLLKVLRIVSGNDQETATAARVGVLEAILQGDRTQAHLPRGLRAKLSASWLFVTAPPDMPLSLASPFSVPLPMPGTATVESRGIVVSIGERRAQDSPILTRTSTAIDIAYNATDLETPFLVRSSRPGDRITPFGLQGRSKLVRDILAQAKTPVAKRDNTPLVVDRRTEEIIWVVGHVQSESTRVTPETVTILRLTAEWKTEE